MTPTQSKVVWKWIYFYPWQIERKRDSHKWRKVFDMRMMLPNVFDFVIDSCYFACYGIQKRGR